MFRPIGPVAALAVVVYRQYRLDHQPPSRRACEVVRVNPLVATTHTSPGVMMIGDDQCSDPVHGPGGPDFGVRVCSDTSRSWVNLRGELDLVSAPHLQQVLDQLCRDGCREIVLDLSELEFLGAAGLTVFHRIDTQLHAVNDRLILHRPPALARRVLAITGLDSVLTIRPSIARSLACDPQRAQRGHRAVRTTETPSTRTASIRSITANWRSPPCAQSQ